MYINPFLKSARIPESELMIETDQVKAYALANFSESHSKIIQFFKNQLTQKFLPSSVLDLGAGSGDMTGRLHTLFPTAKITSLDGSAEMLRTNQEYFARRYPKADILWIQEMINNWIPEQSYDVIFSNSLLHHVSDAYDFWSAIQRSCNENTFIFVSDLIRPSSFEEVESFVTKYTEGEPDILKQDFYNSLSAAYTLEEVSEMISKIRMENKLTLEQISDRHWACFSKNLS